MSGPNSIFFLTDNFFQSTQLLDPNQSLPEGSLDGNYILDVSPLGTVSFMSVVDNDGDNWFTYNSPLQTLFVNTAVFQAESIAIQMRPQLLVRLKIWTTVIQVPNWMRC